MRGIQVGGVLVPANEGDPAPLLEPYLGQAGRDRPGHDMDLLAKAGLREHRGLMRRVRDHPVGGAHRHQFGQPHRRGPGGERRFIQHRRLARDPQVMQVRDAVDQGGAGAVLPDQGTVLGRVAQPVQVDDVEQPGLPAQHILHRVMEGRAGHRDPQCLQMPGGLGVRRVQFQGRHEGRVEPQPAQRSDMTHDRVRPRVARQAGHPVVDHQRAPGTRAGGFLPQCVGHRGGRRQRA